MNMHNIDSQLQRSFIQHLPESRQYLRASWDRNALHDLSLTPRTGFKGRAVLSALASAGWELPAGPNLAVRNAQGQCLLRLGHSEHWILANPLRPGEGLAAPVLPLPGCAPVYCQDGRAWFVLSGESRAQVMAKLCAVDLREAAFPLHAIVQSSVARQNAVILHHAIDNQAVFSLLCDSAAAEYLWLALVDALAEFT